MFDDKTIPQLLNMLDLGRRYGSASVDEMEGCLIKKYLAIPEDERRYCTGDMDVKDSELKELIANVKARAEKMFRAGGECICGVCQHPYRRHPISQAVLAVYPGFDGNGLMLNILCDGTLVKL